MFRKRTAIEVWGTPFLAVAEDCKIDTTSQYVRRYVNISPKAEFGLLAEKCLADNQTFDIEVTCIDGYTDKFYLGNGNLISMRTHEIDMGEVKSKCACCGKQISADDNCFWQDGKKEIFCSLKCAVKHGNYRIAKLKDYLSTKNSVAQEATDYGYTE